ncbi:MAG: peptide ABC transporter permease [Acidimicrobiaceae bacterium]|jgi:peptide/nickel transport system permease protein|nr:peptide ABC transporter permease [Acidimicrobiaceae bacterium]|tara:strand:+ start:3284 stop:4255 length:972 start_codon:yes stop_codon:yes gene_type:complete
MNVPDSNNSTKMPRKASRKGALEEASSGEIRNANKDSRSKVRAFLDFVKQLPVGSTLILGILVFFAICAPLLAPHDPIRPVEGIYTYTPAAWKDGGSWAQWLGTDFLGRDVWSRIIYGARVSVIVGLTGTAAAGAIGMVMGVVAGYFGGWVDAFIMRVVDAWLAIPTLVLAILLSMTLGASMWNIVLILGVVYWTRYARILRGEVLTLRERDFVKLAEVAGAGRIRIITRHIIPNVFNTWMVLASLTVGVVIVAEASLSFLGVGVPAPQPAWGSMLNDARAQLLTGRWWLMAAPAVAIGLTVLGANLFGDWLRVKLDPQQRNL